MKIRLESRKALTAVGILCIFLAAGCALTGTLLRWNQVDASALMKSEAGKQAFNTLRFQTFGPNAQQLFGYFLYKDGIQVETGGGIPIARLGKKTLSEVMADYVSVQRANMFTVGSNLIVREIIRADAVVGYTASDINMDVRIWDITKGDGPPVLRLEFRDLRRDDGFNDRRPQMRGF
jgi:hypothetical protein